MMAAPLDAFRARWSGWAQEVCEANTSRTEPESAAWWTPEVATVIELQYGEARALSPRVLTTIKALRGLDVDFLDLVEGIRRAHGDDAARRALGLAGLAIARWLDVWPGGVTNGEEWIARALASVGREPIELPDLGAATWLHDTVAIVTLGDDLSERDGFGVHWILWALGEPGTSMTDVRWAATCAVDALRRCIDALDTDRALDGELDALEVFLREGDGTPEPGPVEDAAPPSSAPCCAEVWPPRGKPLPIVPSSEVSR